jgi:hypothetical protein
MDTIQCSEKCLLDHDLLIRIDERQTAMSDKVDFIVDTVQEYNKKIENIEKKHIIISQELEALKTESSNKEDSISKKNLSWYFSIVGSFLGMISALVLILSHFKKIGP